MIMNESLYQPILTEHIPLPILEESAPVGAAEPPLPRALAQAAGLRKAGTRVLWLATLFVALSAIEATLLFRLAEPSPLVVYHHVPRKLLLESQGP